MYFLIFAVRSHFFGENDNHNYFFNLQEGAGKAPEGDKKKGAAGAAAPAAGDAAKPKGKSSFFIDQSLPPYTVCFLKCSC